MGALAVGRRRKGLALGAGLSLLCVGLIGCTLLQDKGPELAHWEPVLSSDGTLLAFASPGEKGFEIFVRNLTGGEVQQLTDNEFDDWSPSWSPANDRLVFASSREKNVDLFLIDLASREVVRLTTHEGDDINPHWGADGRILFNSNRADTWEIYSIDPNGQDLIKVTETLDPE